MSSGQAPDNRTKSNTFLRETLEDLKTVLTSRYFYIGIAVLASGMLLNFASQTYLHNTESEGKTLPMLSDLILDNIPFVNLAFFYDLASLLSLLILALYIFAKNELRQLPYLLILIGIFYVVRGIFIVLTPIGNPPMFVGSGAPFNGFSRYELGVYPSGHVGGSFMFFLLARDKFFKYLLLGFVIFIIITLLLSHGHYSIDIFSGIFFSYAIKAFGDKYLTFFDLSDPPAPR